MNGGRAANGWTYGRASGRMGGPAVDSAGGCTSGRGNEEVCERDGERAAGGNRVGKWVSMRAGGLAWRMRVRSWAAAESDQ